MGQLRPLAWSSSVRSASASAGALAIAASALLAAPARAQCFPHWTPVGSGFDRAVNALLALDEDGPGGNPPSIFAGGAFTMAGGVPASRIARWDGSTWHPVGGGLDGTVHALAAHDDDGPGPNRPVLIVGGEFPNAGGIPVGGIASWDGTSWSGFGIGTNASVRAIASFDFDGAGPTPPYLVVGGDFTFVGGVGANRVARWTGLGWTPLANGFTARVTALATFDADGSGPAPTRLCAGGEFVAPHSRVARWVDTGWASMGAGLDGPVRALIAYDSDGGGPESPRLYAGGEQPVFGTSYLARWSSDVVWEISSTHVLGAVRALAIHDDDDDGPHGRKLYAAGNVGFAGSTATYNLAEFDGTSWSSLAYGTDARVRALAPFDDFAGGGVEPALFVGGSFQDVNFQPMTRVAAWTSCGSSVRQFCYAASSSTMCPCGNVGKSETGCDNSTATGGASLVTVGTARLSSDSLQLVCGIVPGNNPAYLMESSSVHPPSPFGDGLLCLAGSVSTLYVDSIVSTAIAFPPPGAPSISAQSAALGIPIAPGSARYYQVRYRDPVTAYCPPPAGDNFNLSSGVAIVWYP